MNRHLGSVAVASALIVSLGSYACSTDQTATGDGDGGSVAREEDGSVARFDAAIEDGATSTDAPHESATDGAAFDSAVDSGVDAMLDTGTDAPVVVDPGPPAVRFVGRFDMTPAAGPKVNWPGAQIIARFSGTEVKATFSDEILYTDYGADRWEAVIDGVSAMTIQLNRAQPTTYTLATGLAAGPHLVELYKLTEGMVGTTQFRGFDFGAGTLLPPPPANTRRLQFLADSSSSGYGVEGASSACSFSAATENERKSYPALVAHDLSADDHNLSAAGKGLYQNYSRGVDLDVFSVIYQHAGVYSDSPLWSHTQYVPDVVWITLGGNDYDDPDGNPNNAPDVPPAGQFQATYDALVTTIRNQHPNAHVFCSVAPSLSNDYPKNYNAYTNVKTAAQNVVTAHADPKLYFFEFTRSADADTTGCEGHVNAAKHRAMADEALVAIKAKTGW